MYFYVHNTIYNSIDRERVNEYTQFKWHSILTHEIYLCGETKITTIKKTTNGLKVVEVLNLNHFVCKREADGRLRDKYDYQLKGTYTDKN